MIIRLDSLIGFFVIIFFCTSCYKPSPCLEADCSTHHTTATKGKVHLEEANNFWLHGVRWLSPPGASRQKFMENDSGATLKYAIYGLIEGRSSYELRGRHTIDTSNKCCQEGSPLYVTDVLDLSNEQIRYDPLNEGVEFYLQRSIDLSAEMNDSDSVVIHSKKEVLSLIAKLGYYDETNYEINLDINDTGASSMKVYHESVVLRGKTYYSVYEIIDDKVNAEKVVPKGYYFSLTHGLIGFYLTNKELWLWKE